MGALADVLKILQNQLFVAIVGTIVIGFLLAIATVIVQDWTSANLNMKRQTIMLMDAIRDMISDDELTSRFYNHPLIRRRSNYISGKQFAEVLLHLIINTNVDDKPDPNSMAQAKDNPTFVKLEKGLHNIEGKCPDLVTAINTRLLGLSDKPDIADSLFQEAIIRVAKWYDEVLDRLTVQYQRRLSSTAVMIGIILAFVSNSDSIGVFNWLYRDPFIREAIIAQASQLQPSTEQPNQPQSPEAIINDVNLLQLLSIPLGWSKVNIPVDMKGWLIKFGGILFSGVAAGVGAPYLRSLIYRITLYRGDSAFALFPTEKES